MTPEQLVAILVAITGVLGAIGILIGQIRQLRHEVNGRLSELLFVTAAAAHKEGEMMGRDFPTQGHTTESE